MRHLAVSLVTLFVISGCAVYGFAKYYTPIPGPPRA